MRVRKATHLGLTLLLAAGLGVCAAPAQAQGATQKKSTSSNSAHRAKSSKKSRRRERGQKVPAKDGSFKGTPNGKWDAPTMEATRKFQEAHGLNPTGKLDAKTLQQLGLGSHTAGVAPPMTPISSSFLQKTPSSQVPRRQK